LLKRALSESFLGEPFDETEIEEPAQDAVSLQQKRKMIMSFRSMSLELAKHKNLLASQLVSFVASKKKDSFSA